MLRYATRLSIDHIDHILRIRSERRYIHTEAALIEARLRIQRAASPIMVSSVFYIAQSLPTYGTVRTVIRWWCHETLY
jgi:hypothetical protein